MPYLKLLLFLDKRAHTHTHTLYGWSRQGDYLKNIKYVKITYELKLSFMLQIIHTHWALIP